MDYRLLLVLTFATLTVKCQIVNKFDNLTVIVNKTKESQMNKTEDLPPAAQLPSLCTICNCTDDIINCDNQNLESHFQDSQWPNKSASVATFKGNSLTEILPFPALEIRKLVLQKNNITKISPRAFKQLINLTELDLSYNRITTENLQPQIFEGKFSTEFYEPLSKLIILNLAHNLLHSLHQDLFEHTPNLKVLNFSGNPFSKIDSRATLAISSLPDLEELDLSYCSLKSLPETQFHSSRNLRKLDLSGNQLTFIPNALEEASALETLYLDENPIQIIDHVHSFPNMPKLKELSLCCMPHLTVIGKGAFSGLTSLENLRIQNSPKLESIDEYALPSQTGSEGPVWPPLKKLYLSDNALRYLPKLLVARWDWLEELDLMNNKWSCDCDNQYLINILLPELGNKIMGEDANTMTCAAPPEHAGKSLLSLSHRKLRCLDRNGAQPEKDATILVGVLIGLLLAIPVCLTLVVLWRRGFFFCGTQNPASFSRAFYKRASNDDDF